MEYEKSSTAFSRKMSNRSHSLSFSANAIYDGVFASKTNTRSPMVDYGEIFRGSSGPSPSSIPFLDVPELNNGGGKVKIDVRSSKLDYSSVFGGFGDCDFAVNPKELIVKSKNDVKRNRRKGGSSYDDVVPLCTEAKKIDSSPDMVRMKHSDIPNKETRQGKESVTTHSSEVPIVAGPAKMVDNISPLRKVESETGVSLVEKKQCNEGVEEVKASSRKRSSKTEVDFGEVFGSNDCGTRDKSTMCNTGSDDGYRDAKPLPSSLQRTVNGGNGGSERLMGMKLGVSEKFKTEDDDDSTSSPPFFDAETDVDSSAAESSAALKKAIEEAQVRMNIAKQMMNRKKSGFRSSAKLKSCDDPKVEDKVDINVGGVTEEIKDNNPQIISEVQGHSSEQSCLDEGDQNVKRARKLWGVPEVLLKTTTDHKREEVEEQEVVQLEEDQARRGRKHWELPGEIFKSVINSKPQEPKNLAPAKPETDTKQEVQPLSENPFYTFGQLGSKLKCVVEAFTGSKVSQKDETQVLEKENSILPQMVQGEQSDSQEKLAAIPVMERCLKEVEETLQQTESKTEIKIEENPESQMCTFAEECSQKMDEEIGGQVMSACDSEDGPKCGGEDFRENPDPTYNFLDQEGEKDIVSGPQEIFVGSDDTKTYVKEVEEIPTHDQSLSKTQVDVSVGTIVSFVTENTQPGHLHEETELKAPRRRRVWKTSEDVCNMIKAPKENNRPWQLENAETETSQMPFQMEGLRIHDTSEETGSTSEQASDSGLQENWTVLKQMFRQMFQTTDTTKVDGETYCLVDSEKEHIDIYQKAGETSYCQMTGTDRYEQNQVETVETEAYAHTRENEDVELAHDVYCREEDGKVEVQGKSSSVHELIREELEATGVASDQEREDVPEAFEEAIWAQGLSQLNEIKEHADTHPEMLEYDPSETDSNKSGERFEKMPEIAREIKTDGSIDTDTSRSSFEMRHGDSYIEEVGVEQDLSDQFHEKNSAASSTEEHIEEIDSDSIQSGWSVVDDDDKINSYVDVSLAGHLQKPEEMEEAKEETDEMKDVTEQEHRFECQKEEVDRSNVEQAESTCSLPKEDENIGASHVKDNEGDESCRSSMEEEGDATSDASQKEAERVKKHLKKKDETREKERERFMVERAIREARERAFADAKERAGKAAMEKAKAGAPRRRAPEVPRRSEKGSVDVNDKLSSAEKASMQAKQRSERAAVERVLSEARERALEKALSNKSAASQTRGYGGSKSFSSSSGEKRASSSSGTENKSSGPSSSSNLPAKGEPIQRCKARSERHQRTSDRAAEALAEKKLHDLKAQKEQAERNRLAESLDADVKRWSSGKESNLRALLSTLQYILGAESGWKPIPLTDLVASASVRKAYRKATLYVHPDKLQQRGASTQQKYICEKVFDLLKEAWNKFGAEER